jgi:hypothetical protein
MDHATVQPESMGASVTTTSTTEAPHLPYFGCQVSFLSALNQLLIRDMLHCHLVIQPVQGDLMVFNEHERFFP